MNLGVSLHAWINESPIYSTSGAGPEPSIHSIRPGNLEPDYF